MTRIFNTTLLLLLALVTAYSPAIAQTASDTLDPSNINSELLEKLALERINKERNKAGLTPFAAHSALYKAADDQVKYIKTIGKTSHKQPVADKATARLRVVKYGGKMRGIGENAAGFTVLRPTKMPIGSNKDTIVTVYSYQQAADILVELWLSSTVHRTNMLYPKFQLSGLSIQYDAKTSMIFVINVLGYQ